MNDHAQSAITGDRRLVQPYLLLAQADAQSGSFANAVEILNQGLSVTELSSNTELIMQLAQVYFQQRDYNRALYRDFPGPLHRSFDRSGLSVEDSDRH